MAELKTLYFLLDLILPLGLGYYLARHRKVPQAFFDRMMLVGIFALAPVLALLSVWDIELSGQLLWLPVFGVLMQVVPGGAGFLWARTKGHDPLEQGGYVLSAMLGNRGVVGLLSVFIVYPDRESYVLSYAYMIMLFGPVVLYGVCFPIANFCHRNYHLGRGRPRPLWTVFLHRNQIPVLGLLIGLGLNLGGTARPQLFNSLVPVLLHVMLVLFVIPVGASMDFAQMRRYWREALDLIPLKFVLTPVAMYLLCRAAGLEGMLLTTVVLMSCAPTAINAVVTAKLFKLNVHVAMAARVLTTGLYLVAVYPLFRLLLWVGVPGMP